MMERVIRLMVLMVRLVRVVLSGVIVVVWVRVMKLVIGF